MMRTPFNLLDDAFFNIERRHEPWSIHFELGFESRIDPAKLADSIRHALDRHPIARARMEPFHDGATRYWWEIPEQPDQVPLTVIKAATDADVARARESLVSLQVPATVSPAFLVYLVQAPGGDRLMMNVNHVIADGMSTFRILNSIIRHYAGLEDPVPTFDPLAVRDLKKLAGTKSVPELVRRLKLLLEHLVLSAKSPGRVMPKHANPADATLRGYGCVPITLDARETKALMARRVKPATINDLVIAGMLLAIAKWNAAHGGKPTRITAMMPMNLRPTEWWFEIVSNFSSYVSINLPVEQQADLATATAAVCEQTQRLKDAGASGILIDVLDVPKFLPAILKARLRDLTPTLGRNLVDSTWVTNLGRLSDVPAMGAAGHVTDICFSPPAPEPMGVTVGVASLEDRMSLTLRYRKCVFDAAAAREFASLFKSILLG
jgi:NRPS condensation-like uncharacterized protein